MQPIVVDTSVAIKWIVPDKEDHVIEAVAILQLLYVNQVKVVVPELFKYEMGNVFTKSKQLKHSQLTYALDILHELPLEYVSMDLSMARKTASLAQACNISFYDASFVALAHEKGIKLVTEDNQLYKKTARYGCVRLMDFDQLY